MADAYEIYSMSHSGEEIDAAVDKANAAVPQTRTVNGKALSADVTLSAKDVGALVKANLLDFVYPVGSIYMSVNNVSPASFLGGKWEQLKDRFLLSAGDIYSAGSTGGEATHTLTVSEMPSHNHILNASYSSAGSSSSVEGKMLAGDDNNRWIWNHSATNNTGDGAAHNNMPPYLAVYMWWRTA